VAPELWNYLCTNYFVSMESHVLRHFNSMHRDRVMGSMRFDSEGPGFDSDKSPSIDKYVGWNSPRSAARLRKSIRIKNMNIVKESAAKSNRQLMLRSFMSIKMRPSEEIVGYVTRLRKMKNKVVDCTGVPVSDDLAVMTLLDGLRIEIASGVCEQQRKDFPGIINLPFDKLATWLLSLNIDDSFELGIGDRVLITKLGSTYLGSVATVLAMHPDSCRIAVKMKNGSEKRYHPSEIALEEMTRRMNTNVEKCLHEEQNSSRRNSMRPKLAARTAAQIAIAAAVHLFFFSLSLSIHTHTHTFRYMLVLWQRDQIRN
jgi:hypothetical protein